MRNIENSEAWRKVKNEMLKNSNPRELLADSPERFKKLSHIYTDPETGERILFDFSKDKVTEETIVALLELADTAFLREYKHIMFSGGKINFTENRAVLHFALRNIGLESGKIVAASPVFLDGQDVMPAVVTELEKMQWIVDRVRSGAWTGATGKRLTTVVNIGIGGSDLGPKMMCNALKGFSTGEIRPLFVSNIDGENMRRTLSECSPEETLFIVVSKTFTTAETIQNALAARRWLVESLGEAAVRNHFLAVSSNIAKASEFGIDPDNIVGFWDWVGGRYSVWSAVGITIPLIYGFDIFIEILRGAHGVDKHFRHTDNKSNIPVLMGMLTVWYSSFLGCESMAILPYEHALATLPAYLQQAEMESCGKQVDHEGSSVPYHTGPIIWGGECTNGQHAFFQLLHQGTRLIPSHFLCGLQPQQDAPFAEKHHQMLIANFLAQTEALLVGRTVEQLDQEMKDQTELKRIQILPHRVFTGNRPSTSILYDRLTPRTLGALVAFYEHKIFVQSMVWGINAFDQWGVELGKVLAVQIEEELGGAAEKRHDASTLGLMYHVAGK